MYDEPQHHATGSSRLLNLSVAMALAPGLAGCAHSRHDDGLDQSRRSARPVEQMSAPTNCKRCRRLARQDLRGEPERQDDRAALCHRAADERANRPGACRDAQARHRLSARTATCSPPMARRSPAPANFKPALDAVRRAQTPEYPDWKLASAEGAILDQLGDAERGARPLPQGARPEAERALVLSNLGMSYVLEGDLSTAETYMRSAVGAPGADSRVRQNLALVVGLQGRFDEAEQIASQELSPEQAQANVTYLRSMLSQQNAWKQLKDGDKKPRPKTN